MYTSQTVNDYSCFKICSRHCLLKVAHKKYQTCRFVDYNFGHLSTEIWYWFIPCLWLHRKSNRDCTAFCDIFPAQCLQISEVLNKHTVMVKMSLKTTIQYFQYHPGNFLPSPMCKFTQTGCSWQSVTYQNGKEIYDIIVRYV